MESLIGWIVLIPLWWCHEAGRYFAARVSRTPATAHWWGVRVDGRRGRRAIAGAGGALASYLVCAALAFAYYAAYGIVTMGPARVLVGDVRPDFDAVGKLAPGDVILTVDHEPLFAGEQPGLVDRVNARGGQPIVLAIDREGVEREVTIQPKPAPDPTGRTRWVLGFRPEVLRPREHDVGTELGAAVRYPAVQLAAFVRELGAAAGSEHADPGGPKRILDEYQRAGPDYSWLRGAMLLACWALIVFLVVDAVRLVPRYAERT